MHLLQNSAKSFAKKYEASKKLKEQSKSSMGDEDSATRYQIERLRHI